MSDPKKIRKIGVAVEFEDGSRTMIYSDDPAANVVWETETETEYGAFGSPWDPRAAVTRHRITVADLHRLTIFNGPNPDQSDRTIEDIRRKIERGPGASGAC